jgi:type VI secretion system protein ImpB
MKELPFVVGVLGDFAAQSQVPLGKVRDRKFVNVDMDNFDDVMGALAPRAAFRVENRLGADGGELGSTSPSASSTISALRRSSSRSSPCASCRRRARLADLRNKLAGNEKLEDLLGEVLANTENLRAPGAAQPEGSEQ